MEIVSLSKMALKIKGKRATLVINPDSTLRGRVQADAVLAFPEITPDTTKIDDSRVILRGVGDYEVGGIKISGIKSGKHFAYTLFIDGISVAFADSNAIEGLRDALSGQQVLVLFVSEKVDMSPVSALEPRVVILYGEKAAEIAPKEGVTTTAKFVVTKEKLPEKMETMLLTQ